MNKVYIYRHVETVEDISSGVATIFVESSTGWFSIDISIYNLVLFSDIITFSDKH